MSKYGEYEMVRCFGLELINQLILKTAIMNLHRQDNKQRLVAPNL